MLPINRIIMYKHGVGYFERRGPFSGESLRLSFPRAAMDDVLKSLVALDLGAGQVLSVDYETPEDRAALLAKGSIHLSDNHSLLDLVRDLRGRRVRIYTNDKPAPRAKPGFGLSNGPRNEAVEEDEEGQLAGLIIGVDFEEKDSLPRAAVAVYLPERKQVRALPLNSIRRLELLDDTASSDLDYFLRAAQSEEERRSATLHLSPGEHDLLVGYIAPAPAWRVSYRVLFEDEGQEGGSNDNIEASASERSEQPASCLLQGWGLFDNQLEEDLQNVTLTLVAGMPVSFRYRLYEPKTPERPFVEDEERTLDGPIFFESAAEPYMVREEAMAFGAAPAAAPAPMAAGRAAKVSMAQMEESVQVSASGEERGSLFAYQVQHPVSVARGQSAMVPILSSKLPARRELLYNGRKLPTNPVASLRTTNTSGLTLERGPVTVLENGDYAGEAVLPFTREGAELIIPYAVELGIKVREQSRSDRVTAGVRVQNEYLLIDSYVVSRREYTITNTLNKPVDVVIEHAPLPGNELYETPEPTEKGAEFMRWSLTCGPNSERLFIVRERQRTSRREQVRGYSLNALQQFLKNKFLDEQTFAALEGVLTLYAQIDQQNRELDKLGKQREKIYQQQKQIQGNLGPLGREGEEGALRGRYVAELNNLEDRLKTLASDEERIRKQIAELEGEVATKLEQLTARD
jgi:hypothetical protein